MAKRSDAALLHQVAGILNLEYRLEASLRQQEETRKHAPEISSQLGTIRGNALCHIRRLEELADQPGTRDVPEPGPPGQDEEQPLQRDLREDFGLLSMTAGGYLMLLTAARALDQAELAELAERHLRDYTEGAVRILVIIPLVVVQSLAEEGVAVREDAIPSVARTVEEIWRSQIEPLAAM